MSFDPGHSACCRVSDMNIFSAGFQNSWSDGPVPVVYNTVQRHPRDPKVLIAVSGKISIWSESGPPWFESIETVCAAMFRETQGLAEVGGLLVDFCTDI